ncbi:MAG: hypothetical protein NTX86_03920 [Candidatus Dependentiae bacterium]|nr:hypothetical protein [Candidatus Dependentiae bacterium]
MTVEQGVKKVGMIILMEQDLAKAVEFYQGLGFRLKFHLKEKWAEFELGDVKLGLCPTSEDLGLIRTGIVLEVEDLKGMYLARKDDIHFFGEPQEAVHGIMVSFKDPSGNVLDLYQPTPEKVKDLVGQTVQKDEDGCCGSEESCC